MTEENLKKAREDIHMQDIEIAQLIQAMSLLRTENNQKKQSFAEKEHELNSALQEKISVRKWLKPYC